MVARGGEAHPVPNDHAVSPAVQGNAGQQPGSFRGGNIRDHQFLAAPHPRVNRFSIQPDRLRLSRADQADEPGLTGIAHIHQLHAVLPQAHRQQPLRHGNAGGEFRGFIARKQAGPLRRA